MSRVRVANGLGLFERLESLRLLAAGDKVGGLEHGKRVVLNAPTARRAQVEASGSGLLIAVGRHHDREGLDAVAGSEFVDDRIRLRE